MDEQNMLAERFESHRGHLRAVAYRMLGSGSEADDAVQQVWLRLSRADVNDVENLAGWLTTVVGRICLDMLRSRKSRHADSLTELGPEARPGSEDGIEPEDEVLLIDSVGRALLVVLDRLAPAERLAFVLHDMFAMPFDEIAPIVERTPSTTKKLASRARRRVQGPPTVPAADLTRQRHVVDAFLAASRGGDFDALIAVLDPDVVRRADRIAVPAGVPTEARGAQDVAQGALAGSQRNRFAQPALVNGTVGIVVAQHGRLDLVLAFTIEDDKITEMDVIADPDRLRQLDLAVLDS